MASPSPSPVYNLLLKETVIPRKIFSQFSGGQQRFRDKANKKIVPRGAIVSLNDTGDYFKVEKSSERDIQSETFPISSDASKERLLPLSDESYRVLAGVSNDLDRYEVYHSGRLQWACSLKSGDKLVVKLKKDDALYAGYADAVLRWSGNHKDEKLFRALYFGVEIVVCLLKQKIIGTYMTV